MLDKNNREIKTGDVVRISGAYFKNDNGLYFVENSPGDVSWCGSDYSLKKISKKGKISVSARNICFWPIAVFVSDRNKRAEANAHNKKFAEIEIVDNIDKTEIVNHFEEMATNLVPSIERMTWNFGKDNECVKTQVAIKEHYLNVAKLCS